MNNRRVDERMIRAFLASVVTGVVVYLVVIRGALPLLTRRLTSDEIDWLRTAFDAHPWAVLGAIAFAAAMLALPVLVVFRIVYGPLKGHLRRSL